MRVVQFLTIALLCFALAFNFFGGKSAQPNDAPIGRSEQEGTRKGAVDDLPLFANAFQVQKEMLADLAPSDFVLSATTGNLVRLKQGFSGVSSLTYQSEEDWKPITDVIAQVIPFTGDESIHFERLSYSRGEDRPIYEFSQRISGVVVSGSKLKIEVDPKTGQIVSIYSSMISDKNLSRPNIGAAEAIEIARYKAREAGLNEYPKHTEPTLNYVRTPRADETEPVWSFTFGNQAITVNAATGKADI
ncbi:MAG: hypothetical protein ACJAR0_002727 [Candidatus Azotimanducaceae bacterium]|jgi:hypothetical protein